MSRQTEDAGRGNPVVSIIAMWAICHPCPADYPAPVVRNAGWRERQRRSEQAGRPSAGRKRLPTASTRGEGGQRSANLEARRHRSLARSLLVLQLHLTIIRSGALISASSGSGWVPVRTGGHRREVSMKLRLKTAAALMTLAAWPAVAQPATAVTRTERARNAGRDASDRQHRRLARSPADRREGGQGQRRT